MILELIQQSHLIKENSTKDDQLSSKKTFHRHLAAPLENVFKQAIEGFNSFCSQEMEDLTDRRPIIEMRIRSPFGSHEETSTSGLVYQWCYEELCLSPDLSYATRRLLPSEECCPRQQLAPGNPKA